MDDRLPALRRDLEFFPVQHENQQLVLIRDHLGLVQEGKAVAPILYQLMILLDGNRTFRELQLELMRQSGGVLVGSEEVVSVLQNLDESYLLHSETFQNARDRITREFAEESVRPCSHSGSGYPEDPLELESRLEEILNGRSPVPPPGGRVKALVSPHIDLSVGHRVYGAAYGVLKKETVSKVLLLGVGHRLADGMFSITEKTFETPLGRVETDGSIIRKLRRAGPEIVAPNDFAHRSEHSLEFQLLFLQHLFGEKGFGIIPVLCGSVHTSADDYSREAYRKKTGPFLETLKEYLMDEETILVAGVDFSHIGPKFGHQMTAGQLIGQSEGHDKRLLDALVHLNADRFWEESVRVQDQFHVCGFSALACMLEILPSCEGHMLDYQSWHEEPTQSAVSFAAAAFTIKNSE